MVEEVPVYIMLLVIIFFFCIIYLRIGSIGSVSITVIWSFNMYF